MEWAASFKHAASRLASDARSSFNETASEFQSKGVGGVFREAYHDTADVVKDLSSSAASSMRKGVETASSWIAGDDVPSLPFTPSSSSRPPRGPVWKPPVAEQPPRLEDLRKGIKVYRRGALAELVKIDYEADPPSLVVRMLEGGNEVGTDVAHISLGPDESLRCLALGVPVRIVELQGRKELNGCRGVLTEYKGDVDRWTVKLTDVGSPGANALANSSSSEAISVKPRNLSVLLARSQEASASNVCPPSRTEQQRRFQTEVGPTSTPVGQKASSEFFADPEVVATEPHTDVPSRRSIPTDIPPRKPISIVAVESQAPKPPSIVAVESPVEVGPTSTPVGKKVLSEFFAELAVVATEPHTEIPARRSIPTDTPPRKPISIVAVESQAPKPPSFVAVEAPVEVGPTSTPMGQKSPSEFHVEPELAFTMPLAADDAKPESVAPARRPRVKPEVEVVAAEFSSPTAATVITVQDKSSAPLHVTPSEGLGAS